MPTFGQHETGQRLHLSGVGIVFALKADDKKTIKVLQPPVGIWSEEQLRYEIDGFLLRYKTQRLIAKTSKNWAPVHEVSAIRAGTEGSSEGIGGEAASRAEDSAGTYVACGAYVLLDRYERSVQSLIDGRVNLDNADLRNIFTGVFRGLLDCRNSAKRAHGDIKPANILLRDSVNLSTAAVHLCDPAPDALLNVNSDKKDLADIGRILYELVNLRPYQQGTIGRSKEWDRLGPNGEDWRKLCTALLDAQAPAEERDLEKLLPRIDTWRAKPKKSKAPMIAAAVVLFLIAGGITTFLLLRPPKPKWDEAKWDQLCLESHAWFQDFYIDAKKNTDTLAADGRYPKTAIDLLNDAFKKRSSKAAYYLPVEIAQDNSGGEIRALVAMPTNEAKIHPGPAYTLTSLKLVGDLEAALKPDNWGLLHKLQANGDTYAKDRHWQEPADAIKVLVDETQPPEIPAGADALSRYDAIKPKRNIIHALENAVKASDAVTNIETEWAGIAANIGTIQKLETSANADVPILHDIATFARQTPTSATSPGKTKEVSGDAALAAVQGFADKLKPAADTLSSLATALTREKIDLPTLAAAKEYNLPPSIENYRTFSAHVHDYAVIPDPRKPADWEAHVSEIGGIIEVIQQTAPSDPEIAALSTGLTQLRNKIAETKSLALIELHRQALNQDVSDIEKGYATLRDRGFSNPNYIDPPKEKAVLAAALSTPPKELAGVAPIVLDQWRHAHQSLVDAFSGLDDTSFRRQYRRTMPARLATAYADLDRQMRVGVPTLDMKSAEPWQSKIAAHLLSRFHDESLKTLITDYAAQYKPQQAPDIQDHGYQSFAQAHVQAYLARCATGRDFIDGYTTVEACLNQLYLQRDEPTAGAPYWSDVADKLAKFDFLPDDQVEAALKESGLSDRIANLQTLVATNDYARIEPALSTDAAEIVLTAWRKLGTIALPESVTYLDADAKAQDRVKTLLKQHVDPARAQAILAEMDAAAPQHWHHWAVSLTNPEVIGAALERRPSNAQLQLPGEDDRLVYNQYLHDLYRDFNSLKAQPDPKQREAALKTATLTFISKAESTSADIQKTAALPALVAVLKKPLDPKNAEASNTTKAGPKLIGWESEIDNNNGVARFFYPPTGQRQYTLEFRRLPDQADGRTVYLCTTELSLDLFAHALNDPPGRVNTLNKPNWLNIADDSYTTWSGIRGWRIANGMILPNTDWLCKTALMGKYADIPQGGRQIEPPNPQMPVQRISPWVALYTARLLGCRLPTPTEWTSAYNAFESQPGPKDWNLRGAAFDAQKQYVKSLNTNDLYVAWPYPDKDIFENAKTVEARGDAAPVWLPDNLVKMEPNALDRANAEAICNQSVIWFRKVPAPSASGAVPAMHDLVGNVAEYTFDGPNAAKPLTERDIAPTTDIIETDLSAGTLAVVGGSSLSSPLIPFNVPQPATNVNSFGLGRCDVGMRLAFTAPVESIESVLSHLFQTPKYLPAPARNAASLIPPQ
ncbi:MAG TPA: hypothetical protein VM008_20660 [Phycisphaerae bacterium]|nr:hypothetical protein [Phycisphaerae bacterium]